MVKRKKRIMDHTEEVPDGEVAPTPTTTEPEVVARTEEPSEPEEAQLPIEEVARQVSRGKWGNPASRRLRLQQAGYDPKEVQREIVRQANQ